MKKAFFLFIGAALLFASCNEDEITLPDADLNYDGPNQSAPFLPAGIHEAAARFPAAQTGQFAGENLVAVDFYIQDLPGRCVLRIYGPGAASEPGNILYQQDVTSGIAANAWNRYNLTSPIPITGEDLWIGILVEHNSRLASIGCDPGPAVENGDWLLPGGRFQWQTLRQYSNNGVNINWNIRGFVGN